MADPHAREELKRHAEWCRSGAEPGNDKSHGLYLQCSYIEQRLNFVAYSEVGENVEKGTFIEPLYWYPAPVFHPPGGGPDAPIGSDYFQGEGQQYFSDRTFNCPGDGSIIRRFNSEATASLRFRFEVDSAKAMVTLLSYGNAVHRVDLSFNNGVFYGFAPNTGLYAFTLTQVTYRIFRPPPIDVPPF